MVKHIALLKAKAGMTRDTFVRRYEEEHVPLLVELVPHFKDYRRSYLIPGSMVSMAHVGKAAPPPSFDVVTELWHENQERVDQLMHDLSTTNTGTLIAESETHLIDRMRTILFAAEEYVTAAEHLAPRPTAYTGHPAVKMMCVLKKKPGMSRAAFITYYETGHAPLALNLLVQNGHPLFAHYRRSFPAVGGELTPGDASNALPEIGFDAMTEISFWTEADYRQFQHLCSQQEIGSALATDEENLFDRNSITMFLADERNSSRESS